MNKYDRKVMLIVSDTHAGHKLGLCSPDTVLEDATSGSIKKYSPVLSEPQEFLWEVYLKGIQETIKLADKDDVIVFHDGDPTQGNWGRFPLMTSRMSDQILMAKANFVEILKYPNVKHLRMGLGTALHECGEGSTSYTILDILREKYPKINMQAVYHGLLNYHGVEIDYAHKGTSKGGRKWLEGNVARYYLRDIMMREILSNKKPPDLVLRGHYHVYHREWLEISTRETEYASWLILLPGFMYKDDYVRSVTRSEYEQPFGIVAVEVINGQIYQTHKFITTLDLRTHETIL